MFYEYFLSIYDLCFDFLKGVEFITFLSYVFSLLHCCIQLCLVMLLKSGKFKIQRCHLTLTQLAQIVIFTLPAVGLDLDE